MKRKITMLFILLLLGIQTLIVVYWFFSIEPRIIKSSYANANALSQAISRYISDSIHYVYDDLWLDRIIKSIDILRISKHPDTDKPFILGVHIQIDTDVIQHLPESTDKTLDIKRGDVNNNHFISTIPLYSSETKELIAISKIYSSMEFIDNLKRDVRNRLFSVSILVFIFLLLVWYAINKLYDKLMKKTTELEKYKNHLEEQIEHRTTEIVKNCQIIEQETIERKRIYNNLIESEYKYKSIIDNIELGIAMISSDMEIVSLNRQMMQWFPDVDVSKVPTCYKIFNTESKDNICSHCPTRNTLKDGKVYEVVTDITTNRGVRHYRIISSPIKDHTNDIVAAIEMFDDITERRVMEQELMDSREELNKSREKLRELSSYLQDAIEQERLHIARELHDGLGQILMVLKMDASWLKQVFSSQNQKKVYDKTQGMIKLINSALSTIREITFELRPVILDDLGLLAAIKDHIDKIQNRFDIDFSVTTITQDLSIDNNLSTILFRIFQESITNVIRHAKATRARVTIVETQESIQLTISDNGIGIKSNDLYKPKSFGIMGIKERLLCCDGYIKIRGINNRGTTVKVKVHK